MFRHGLRWHTGLAPGAVVVIVVALFDVAPDSAAADGFKVHCFSESLELSVSDFELAHGEGAGQRNGYRWRFAGFIIYCNIRWGTHAKTTRRYFDKRRTILAILVTGAGAMGGSDVQQQP